MVGKSGKKPVSLNDSHYRFLQDLSAPPKPYSKLSDDEDKSSPTILKGSRQQQGKALFRDEEDDSVPRFSAITDFDSPIELCSAEDKQPVKVDNGRHRLCTVSTKENIKYQGDNIPESKEASDSDTHKVEKKTKVKMEGRRRLCKVSYADNDNTDKMVALDELEVSDLVDFDSPPLPTKKATGIEKSQAFVVGNETTEDKNIDYASADSSFSAQHDPCDSSSDASKGATGGIEHVEDDSDDSVEGKGGILGDDMGLGKTMQICSFLAGLFNSHLIKRALVVAPKTLLPHWIKELSVVGLSEKTREYFGTCTKLRDYELQYILQDKGVLLTTYDIVRNNSKSLRGIMYLMMRKVKTAPYGII
ncbi:hypothetical protein K1719_014643 [Acacia pycnantha]|nr:hypothetical protein K1719_014643 [Acacia pycnantha]